jgi:hypothetical protein
MEKMVQKSVRCRSISASNESAAAKFLSYDVWFVLYLTAHLDSILSKDMMVFAFTIPDVYHFQKAGPDPQPSVI